MQRHIYPSICSSICSFTQYPPIIYASIIRDQFFLLHSPIRPSIHPSIEILVDSGLGGQTAWVSIPDLLLTGGPIIGQLMMYLYLSFLIYKTGHIFPPVSQGCCKGLVSSGLEHHLAQRPCVPLCWLVSSTNNHLASMVPNTWLGLRSWGWGTGCWE